MRFRTKLLLTGGGVVVLLWLGTLAAVSRTISANSNHLADLDFDGTRKNLHSLQAERVARMRQAGALLMSIPELRALIAEHNYEVSAENVDSLQERLDSFKDVVGVSFICVLDARGELIAQNRGSPWKAFADLDGFLSRSPQAPALVKRLFSRLPGPAEAEGQYALWEYQGKVYQVVGQALVFNGSGSDGPPVDGALIMAAPLTDELASDLGGSHNCQVSFLAEGQVAASSLAAEARAQLVGESARSKLPLGRPFDVLLAGVDYRSFLEDLRDPCSGVLVGQMLIQDNRTEAAAASRHISNSLIVIMATGLGLAAVISLPLSTAVTRPVRELVRGVRRVAGGDLDFVLPAKRGDELGELARAFNDMVLQLRTREELQRLVETSQAGSKAKSQFLANMSHEIRTPLNGVIGVAELLLRTELSARQRRYAGLVKSSAEVLTTLINDILDFSKIEAGKLELESVVFDPHAVVDDVVEMMAPKAAAKGLEMVCYIHPGVPGAVRGDPNRLRQVLMNLISNAVKFTEAGHVAVRVTREDAADGRCAARFAVSDTGIGIPAERMDRLFKSFSQVDASTTRRFGGTGLGLAISKQLAELMGGRIGVESQPGAGSTFWFAAAFEATAGAPPVARPGLKSARALVIEENDACRQALRDMLADEEMDVVVADDEATARHVLDRSPGNPIAIAIVGRRPCHAGGPRETIEAGLFPAGTRTVLLVHAEDEAGLPSHFARGFDRVITKPARRSQLVDAVGDLLCPVPGAVTGASESAPAAPARIVQPYRILLAEDNEVNQVVAADLLAEAGYACDVVADGKQAVRAATTGDYSLVLMDCQMPLMDGFEAAAEIRRREHENAATGVTLRRRRVPIIALTANAAGGDRERCIEAGMDDYCGKPFEPRQFLDKVVALLPPLTPKTGSPAAPLVVCAPEPAASREALLSSDAACGGVGAFARTSRPPSDISSPRDDAAAGAATGETSAAFIPPIDFESLLRRCSGKPALARVVLEKFEKQVTETYARLEACESSGDSEQIARSAHALKGTAGIVGAGALRDLAARLEEVGRAGDLALVRRSLASVRDEIRRCAEYAAGERASSYFQQEPSDAHSDR